MEPPQTAGPVTKESNAVNLILLQRLLPRHIMQVTNLIFVLSTLTPLPSKHKRGGNSASITVFGVYILFANSPKQKTQSEKTFKLVCLLDFTLIIY